MAKAGLGVQAWLLATAVGIAPLAVARPASSAPKREPSAPAPPVSSPASSTALPPTPPERPAAAPVDPSPNPKRGVSARSVALDAGAASPPGRSLAKAQKPEPPRKPGQVAPPSAHQKGKPPHKPAPALPTDVPFPVPNRVARQVIAEGPTDEDLRAGKDDPELRSLQAAERVLFPQTLRGLSPGWSWDLPQPLPHGGPAVNIDGGRLRATPSSRVDALENGPDSAWLKSLALPNFPVVLDEFVIKYLRFYRDSASGKAIARVWAKKSGRYTASMRAELARALVPTDLVWLSMIESGHNPTISSPAGAVGLWQFLPDAARNYGLTVDRWVDERQDPERSTEAAGRYLSDLYRRFGSWDLAIASYNMGYGGLTRAIRKFNSNDFWELARYEAGVPWETALYVPKIFALAIVMSNRRAFGLDTVELDPPESFDSVSVGASVPLADVARAAGVSPVQIEALNPGYLAGRTPPWSSASGAPKPTFTLRVPAGTGAACEAALASTFSADATFDTYLSKLGDTLASIADAQGVSEMRLRALNRIDAKELLAPGTLLLVPREVRSASSGTSEEVVVVPPREFSHAGRRRIFYRVAPGDTLERVAREFDVSVGDLGSWNALDRGARLQSGMALQLFVAPDKPVTARTLAVTRVLIAGSPEFYDYFEAQNGRKRVVVSARPNDTLGTIGKRYGMTFGSMERINRRSRGDRLSAGESVVVYVDRGRALPGRVNASPSESVERSRLTPLDQALESAIDAPLEAAGSAEAVSSPATPASSSSTLSP